MRISAIYIRFFRAFNYDYLRKVHEDAKPSPWDDHDGKFYPYVRVDLADEITCVVGANESGKSQLLKAVKCALGSEPAVARDFCRYSEFFTVDNALQVPQFGLRLELDGDDRETVATITGTTVDANATRIHLFRDRPDTVRMFIGNDTTPVEVSAGDEQLRDWLPKTFSIEPKEPVPESVPLDFLMACADGTADENKDPGRKIRWATVGPLVERLHEINEILSTAKPDPATLKALLPQPAKPGSAADRKRWQLAYDLLVTVGGIDTSIFARLKQALRDGDDGFAGGLVASMTQQLSAALNLRRWWTQDEKFELLIQTRDFDLVFTIKDRTASEYTFEERSDGLKYFLSYLVQYLRHVGSDDPASILLMDEPDAYLSNQAQQDLLRLFQDFVDRETEATTQVVFVTHSPFLIDKNRADRVRVLDKGADDEGTRVVRDVSRNHFEPLRSAFGGFVAETAFIGNCNVLVEGAADQVYLAGMSSEAVRREVSGSESLNLNSITLVNAGSSSEMPYTAFLALGRSKAEQPAIVVLLDGDKAGRDAAKAIETGYTGKPLLASKYVLNISSTTLPHIVCDRPDGPQDIEDLVPVSILLEACKRFAAEIGLDSEELPEVADVLPRLTKTVGTVAAVAAALKASGSDLRPDKVPLARHVVNIVAEGTHDDTAQARENFRQLFIALTNRQDLAVAERSQRGVGKRVNRATESFLKDHKDRATRSELKQFFNKVEGLLDATDEAEEIRTQIRKIRNRLDLQGDLDLSLDVADYPKVKTTVGGLRYAAVLASQHDRHAPRSAAEEIPNPEDDDHNSAATDN